MIQPGPGPRHFVDSGHPESTRNTVVLGGTRTNIQIVLAIVKKGEDGRSRFVGRGAYNRAVGLLTWDLSPFGRIDDPWPRLRSWATEPSYFAGNLDSWGPNLKPQIESADNLSGNCQFETVMRVCSGRDGGWSPVPFVGGAAL